MSTELDYLISNLQLQNELEEEDNYLSGPRVPLQNIEATKDAEGYRELITDPYKAAPLPSQGKKKTLTELANDDEFSMRAERFLEGVGRNEDIFEYLRDADYSLTAAFKRSMEVGSWTNEQKEDYVYLTNAFQNAETSGFIERFNAFKDIGIDLVSDPLNLLTAFFLVPTGGQSLTTNAAASLATKQGLKKFTKAQLQDKTLQKQISDKAFKEGVKETALMGASQGLVWGGLHNYFIQDIDVDLGLQGEIDLTSAAKSSLMGGAAGGILAGGLRAGIGKFKKAPETNENMPKVLKEKEYKFSNEQAIDDAGDINPRQKINEESELDNFIGNNTVNWWLSRTIGKPVTEFLGYVKSAPSLKNLLASFRYDYATGVRKGQQGVQEITLVNGEKTTETFGEFLSRTNGGHQFALAKAFNVLYRVGWRAKVWDKQNKQIGSLLRDDTLEVRQLKGDNYKVFTKDGTDLSKLKEYKLSNGNVIDIDDAAIESFIGARVELNKAFSNGQKAGIFLAGTTKVQNYLPRVFNYSALSNKANRARFEKQLIESGHANPMNEKDVIEIARLDDGTVIKGNRLGDLGVDSETFGMNFIERASNGRVREVADATAEELLSAKQLKANKIVQDMLDNRFTPLELRLTSKKGTTVSGYVQPRRFTNLKDNDIDYVLENDVQTLLEGYFTNISRATARAKYFGKTIGEIRTKKIDPIIDELRASGMSIQDANEVGDNIYKMIERLTGFETYQSSVFKNTKVGSYFSDWGKLIQQMAHLPLATLSSVTEPIILLSRAGLPDGLNAAKDLGKAIRKEGSSVIDRTIKGLQRGVLRKKTKGIKDLDDETWQELYKTGLALEQSVLERLEGLMGEGIQSNLAKNLQQGFFKTNLLTQWTKAVQLASFTTGKRLITKNAKLLSEGKLSKSQTEYYTRQLNELGIQADDAVSWYKKYNVDGVFDFDSAKTASFYQQDLTRGANRFTKEIILNPSTAEANRPTWFSTPAATMLVQFAGYPTVFNNTILKRFANESLKNPMTVGLGKVLPTVVLMTSVAHMGNYLRSNGNNEIDQETGKRKPDGEILLDAVRRWGGLGPLDYGYRYNSEASRNVGDVAAALKTVAGPLPQDFIDGILYRKGVAELVATNLPGYSAYDIILGDGTRKNLRSWARGSTSKKDKKPRLYSKGGIVLNVPNVIDEPDERIDRMTGVPYDVQAGVVLQDEEERLFAYKGGSIKEKLKQRKRKRK